LATGNDNGFISVYDISCDTIQDDVLKPINSFKAHDDCVNGVRYWSIDSYELKTNIDIWLFL